MKLELDLDLVKWLELLTISKTTFQWDGGNSTKSRKKHKVRKEEVEELFHNAYVVAGKVLEPYHPENRWILFGVADSGRKLALIFTVRDGLIRPISCRAIRKKEAKIYEKEIKRLPGR